MSKLLVAIVHDDDAGPVMDALRDEGHRVTRLRSVGGFLKAGNSTLLVGVDDEAEAGALGVIERECRRRSVEVPPAVLGEVGAGWMPTVVEHGGATVFVVDLTRTVRV